MDDESSLNGYEPDPEFNIEYANAMRAFETLGRFLEEDEWYPQRAKDRYGYWVTYNGENSDIPCFAQVRVKEEQLLIYADASVKVPESHRPAVAEFIARANYGLVIGNFELNFDNGKLRYKSSLDFEGDELSEPLVRQAIYPAVRTMNRYLPGVLKIIYASVAPAAAITEIEGA